MKYSSIIAKHKRILLPRNFLASVIVAMSFFTVGNAIAEERAVVPHSANEEIVLKAMTRLFGQRDTSVIEELWAKDYKQHNPTMANSTADLKGMIEGLPAAFKYEPGFIASNGDIVMIHSRYSGFGPKPFIIVDIFRVSGGKLHEHWDVIQEDVPAEKTKSGNPMFTPEEAH